MFDAADAQVAVTRRGDAYELSNNVVSVLLTPVNGSYCEQYSAHGVTVLRSGHDVVPDPDVMSDGARLSARYTRASVIANNPGRSGIRLEGSAGVHLFRKEIMLYDNDPFVHVKVADSVSATAELSRWSSVYSFVPEGKMRDAAGNPRFTWTPQLRPMPHDVIGDHTFRSPALMMQNGSIFAAVVPDVSLMQPWRSIQTAGDMQVDTGGAPLISYGVMNWRTRSHVFYMHTDDMTTQMLPGSRWTYGYYVYCRADAPPDAGFRDVVRFHWNNTGHGNLVSGTGPQGDAFATLTHKAWYGYLPTIVLDTVYDGRDVTLLRQGRLAWSNALPADANNDCWFTVWFNALRTAYGMYVHAQEAGDSTLAREAIGVLSLALSAPRKEGIAPSVFYADRQGGHWVNDQGWGGIDAGRDYAMFPNAWTCVWLLKWADLLPDKAHEILGVVRTFADFLVRNQEATGVIPSWYEPSSLKPVAVLRDMNAETAGAALLLSEFYATTHEEKYQRAAEHALGFIRSAVLPEQKWFDFETFYSCSRKSPDFFDSYTQQYPQNTLSMQIAADACASLFRATGDTVWLTTGTSILDYLCLYQQVWSPAWLSRPLFGGFGVQNTDGEWSDARQAYCAMTLMSYYDLTNEREYFERGVAALRATFGLFESDSSARTFENYAHSAVDRPGGVTGIHWGTGSAVVSVQLAQQRYGGALVNVSGGWGVGIDGCTVTEVTGSTDMLRVSVRDDVATPRTIRMTFDHCTLPAYDVVINGKPYGRCSADALQKGIAITL